MAHIFFIDPIEKLTVKKDSSLILALALQDAGEEVRLLFEKDFYLSNHNGKHLYTLSTFCGEWDGDGFYLKNFSLQGEEKRALHSTDTLQMRLEPPFDKRYLNYLWMLHGLQARTGITIINSPQGLLLHNEKICAYQMEGSVNSFVGSAADEFIAFVERLKKSDVKEVVLKPLDLYQGEGVEKTSVEHPDLMKQFEEQVRRSQGPIVAQPFLPQVYQGEIRSVFFNGRELGSILKIPRKGDFLSTVARGATCHPATLNPQQQQICERAAQQLRPWGISWIAFDILGDAIQEANITCPGLLPELSRANGERLVEKMVKSMLS